MTIAQVIVASCSRRELELGQMRDFLSGNGYTVSSEDWSVDGNADLILLSTCGFTEAAEDFGFETLHRIRTEKKPSAQVVLCGCIPEINPTRVKAEFGGETLSPQSYDRLDRIISAERPFGSFARPNTIPQKTRSASVKDDLEKALELLKTFDGSFSGLQSIASRIGNGLTRRLIRGSYANLENARTFYIQIQEGCAMDCTYCSIKTAIGRPRSRPVAKIMEEFRNGLDQGYEQFQLVGDNAGGYGLDIKTNLGVLLNEIATLPGKFRIDLTDINPVYLKLIAEPIISLARAGRISRLYVPIQSGSGRILTLMKRGCDLELVRKTLQRIRASVPKSADFRMGTSIIVGFPSETSEELDATIEFCKSVKFDWVWCHSFSVRRGTPAADMEGQLPPEETLARARKVKKALKAQAYVTTAEDSAGNRTCQG